MAEFPAAIRICEEGPREGFQYEKGAIPTTRKIELIDALSTTGLDHVQIVSFVNPKAVPGMADADAVVAGIAPRPGVAYSALWLNGKGFERALAYPRLHVAGAIRTTASEPFLLRNQNRDFVRQRVDDEAMIALYQSHGVAVTEGGVMAAFGCNFMGDVSVPTVVAQVREQVEMAERHGEKLAEMMLADTMGWATPIAIRRMVGAVRNAFPDLPIRLHLHDTRGMGIANAYAGLEMGVTLYDSSVAGLGGCPFAGNKAAAGNVCTEDLVFLCAEMGIATGIDLDALIECAILAEDIVGHPLPGSVKTGGSLRRLREQVHATA